MFRINSVLVARQILLITQYKGVQIEMKGVIPGIHRGLIIAGDCEHIHTPSQRCPTK